MPHNRPGQDATAAHTTNTTTRRPEAMKRRGEKKTSESTTNLPYARRLQNFTNRTTTALQHCWLLCSALFLYAFATLLGLSGGCVSGLNTTTTHPSYQGRRKIWKSEGACSNLMPFKRERICFYSFQNRGRGSDCPHAPTVPTALHWRMFWLFVVLWLSSINMPDSGVNTSYQSLLIFGFL